jgi:hypothetical protein
VIINQIVFIGCAGIVAECADRAQTAQSGRAASCAEGIVAECTDRAQTAQSGHAAKIINLIIFLWCAEGIVAECTERAQTAQSERAAKRINRIVFYGARRESLPSALTELRLLKVGARQRELIRLFFLWCTEIVV